VSGIGIEEYADFFAKNLVFAFIQFAAVFVMYFIFTGAVKWERAPKDYLAWTGMCVGFVVLVQLLENYLSGRIFIGTGLTIDREMIATGWGMHNNIGGMMAMMLPFAFYLARTRKHGWIFNLLGSLLLGGVIASCSRTSMVVAVLCYCVCAVVLLRCKRSRVQNLIVYLVAGATALVFGILFWDQLFDIFYKFIDEIFIMSSRDKLIVNGCKQFWIILFLAVHSILKVSISLGIGLRWSPLLRFFRPGGIIRWFKSQRPAVLLVWLLICCTEFKRLFCC
jgi:hypothetical protein